MTAPARPATLPPNRSGTVTRRRAAESERGRSRAVQRAYARRAQRTGLASAAHSGADAGRRAPFVVLLMVVLVVALVSTLWLSTAAAADSYQLRSAQEQARDLMERSENLGREVATLEAAPEVARRARELGMVPAGDPARLVVRPDGAVIRIGQPQRAMAPAPPPAAEPPVAEPPVAEPPVAEPPVAEPPAPAQPEPGVPAPAGDT